MSETAADEQDLAKALDSVANAAVGSNSSNTSTATIDSGSVSTLPPVVSPISPSVATPAPIDGSFPPVPAPTAPPNSFSTPLVSPLGDSSNQPEESTPPSNSTPEGDNNSPAPADSSSEPVVTGPLADIKNEALNELRPLVDKLNVSPEEKFDTLLLLIRSTDDSSLIGPAHDAAKQITDEARRAEALLDIIKEIDFLSRQDKPAN